MFEEKTKKLSAEEFEKIKAEIIKILQIKECTVNELSDALQFKEKKVLETIVSCWITKLKAK